MIATETDSGDGFGSPTKKPKLGSLGGGDVRSAPVAKPKPEKEKKTKGDKNPAPEVANAKGTSKENKRKEGKEKKNQAVEPAVYENEDGDEGSERDQSPPASEEDDSVPPIHESLAGVPRSGSTSPSKKGKKYAPPGETPDQRDSRTIFVGNVPFQVMTTKVS